MAGFGNAVESKIVDHLTGKTAYSSPAPLYLAAVTVAVAETDTAATTTEANYTGYARKQVPAADWNAASGGSATNSAQEMFADCTAGASTVIGWFLTPAASGDGDVVLYGTAPTVSVTPTQSPLTLAASALSIGVD